MAAFKKDSEREQGEQGEPPMPRDLIDFYQRWSEFRPTVVALTDRSELSLPERQIVQWLIMLADRISEHDVQP